MISYNRDNEQDEAILMDVLQSDSPCRGTRTKTKTKVIYFL